MFEQLVVEIVVLVFGGLLCCLMTPPQPLPEGEGLEILVRISDIGCRICRKRRKWNMCFLQILRFLYPLLGFLVKVVVVGQEVGCAELADVFFSGFGFDVHGGGRVEVVLAVELVGQFVEEFEF